MKIIVESKLGNSKFLHIRFDWHKRPNMEALIRSHSHLDKPMVLDQQVDKVEVDLIVEDRKGLNWEHRVVDDIQEPKVNMGLSQHEDFNICLPFMGAVNPISSIESVHIFDVIERVLKDLYFSFG